MAVDGRGGEEAGAGFGAFVDAVFPPGSLPLAEVAEVEGCRPRKEKDSTDFSPQPSVSEEFQVLHVGGGDHGLVAKTSEFRSLRSQDDVAIES